MAKVFTKQEVAQHNSHTDCWIIVGHKVYDVTKFARFHPGGAHVLLNVGGTDATVQFNALHNADKVLSKYSKRLCVGTVAGATEPKKETLFEDVPAVPYSEPYWYNPTYKNAFYTQSHLDFAKKVRAFIDTEISPFVNQWDESGKYPMELHQKAYAAGLLGATWPKEYGGTPPEGFDAFHDMIFFDELARCGSAGILTAVFFSFNIALPPVLMAGSDYLKDKVCRDVISGKKIMALAVTEPYAGSDVANLKCTARRDGDSWVINGEKKFISSANKAHFLTVAVRTGGSGHGGVSILLVETDPNNPVPGLTVRRQKTQGWWSSNTCYVTFENVRVPLNHLVGPENKGFKYIMHNFNHERYTLAIMSNRFSRICLEDAIKFARVRKTFGKRLIDHQVIRHKIMEMARKVEACHAHLEQITYQMKAGVDHRALGGPIAILKVTATKTMEFCAREASQIMGGNCFVRGGIGERVERIYREVRVSAIGAGSEEVMLDLGARQAKL